MEDKVVFRTAYGVRIPFIYSKILDAILIASHIVDDIYSHTLYIEEYREDGLGFKIRLKGLTPNQANSFVRRFVKRLEEIDQNFEFDLSPESLEVYYVPNA